MAIRYKIWNKQDRILTVAGENLSAEEWIARHPIAALDSITVLCRDSEINGAVFGVLEHKVKELAEEGADFSSCVTNEDKLNVIHAFLDAREAEELEAAEEARARDMMQADSLASIAASLEYQNMMTLDDVEV